jgi:hypothetical protein
MPYLQRLSRKNDFIRMSGVRGEGRGANTPNTSLITSLNGLAICPALSGKLLTIKKFLKVIEISQ